MAKTPSPEERPEMYDYQDSRPLSEAGRLHPESMPPAMAAAIAARKAEIEAQTKEVPSVEGVRKD